MRGSRDEGAPAQSESESEYAGSDHDDDFASWNEGNDEESEDDDEDWGESEKVAEEEDLGRRATATTAMRVSRTVAVGRGFSETSDGGDAQGTGSAV